MFRGNPDDDEDVELYQDKRAEAEHKKAEKMIKKRLPSTLAERATWYKQMIKIVLRNVESGDCAERRVGTCHLFVLDPDLLSVGAVQLVLGPSAAHIRNSEKKNDELRKLDPRSEAFRKLLESGPSRWSDDAELLESVSDDDAQFMGLPARPNLLKPLFGTGRTMAAAVPALVNAVVHYGFAAPTDAPRLLRKWTAWLEDIPWSKGKMTFDNRPSLASWIGFPWQAMHIMDEPTRLCGLRHGLDDLAIAAVDVAYEMTPISKLVPADQLDGFVPVWASDGSARVSSVGTALKHSHDKAVAFFAAQAKPNGKKRKK